MLALLSATAQAFTLWPLRAPAGTRRQADASQVVPLTESVRAAAQLVRAPDSSRISPSVLLPTYVLCDDSNRTQKRKSVRSCRLNRAVAMAAPLCMLSHMGSGQ